MSYENNSSGGDPILGLGCLLIVLILFRIGCQVVVIRAGDVLPHLRSILPE